MTVHRWRSVLGMTGVEANDSSYLYFYQFDVVHQNSGKFIICSSTQYTMRSVPSEGMAA